MLNTLFQIYYVLFIGGILIFVSFFAWFFCPVMLVWIGLIAYGLFHKLPIAYWGKYHDYYRKHA